MNRIYSQQFAGREVWLGDGLVAFGDDGFAIGVVKRLGPGPRLAPQPLGESQFEAAAQSAAYEVLPAQDEAAETPRDTAADTEVAAEAAAGVDDEGQAEEIPRDLQRLNRRELYELAKELGLDVDWVGTSAADLRAAIEAHRSA
ncbi:MAG: hypothetical protein AB7Y46_08015 [Armatimonadota bacterium]